MTGTLDKSPIDQKILRNARKPLTEIAEITGLPAEAVAERRALLLESPGMLTERQEERLVLMELDDFIRDARDMLETAKDADQYSKLLSSIFAGMKLITERMDARRKIVEDDMNRITTAQSRLWAQAIRIAAHGAFLDLRDEFPGIDPMIVQDAFERNLEPAVKELESHIG